LPGGDNSDAELLKLADREDPLSQSEESASLSGHCDASPADVPAAKVIDGSKYEAAGHERSLWLPFIVLYGLVALLVAVALIAAALVSQREHMPGTIASDDSASKIAPPAEVSGSDTLVPTPPVPPAPHDTPAVLEGLFKGPFEPKIAYYNEAIRLDPKSAAAYSNRGATYTYKRDYDKAIADYTEAIRLKPDSAEAYLGRGVAYGYKSEHDKAIADYTEAIRLKPDSAEAHSKRGLAYAWKGDIDKVIADCTEAIRLKPDSAEAYYGRGVARYGMRLYDQAIADLTEAIRLEPKNPLAYRARGWAFKALGRDSEANKDFAAESARKKQ